MIVVAETNGFELTMNKKTTYKLRWFGLKEKTIRDDRNRETLPRLDFSTVPILKSGVDLYNLCEQNRINKDDQTENNANDPKLVAAH